jgi:holo-[acyl-carrier protein] synthase
VGAVSGIGIDAVDLPRFRQVLTRRPSIVERVFTDAELAYAESSSDRAPHLAARFAAKEAVMKTLGVGIGAVGWRDVEVTRDDAGAPALVLSGRAADLAKRRGVLCWHLSLTHTETVAIASVMAEGASGDAGGGTR